MTTAPARVPRTVAARGAVRGGGADALTGLRRPVVHRTRRQPLAVNVLLRVSVPILIVLLWWWVSAAGLLKPQLFPPPGAVWQSFLDLSASGVLWENLSASLGRAVVGFVVGAAIGLSLGVISGLFRIGDQLIDPSLQMLRMVPELAIIPLLIIWFGIDELPKLIIIGLAAMIPMYLNTHLGVRHVDPKLLEAGRAFGLSDSGLVRNVVLVEARPQILFGLRISVTVALMALAAAELLNARTGIGFLMSSAQMHFQTSIVILCVLIYALFGLAADLVVRGLERWLIPYKFARRR